MDVLVEKQFIEQFMDDFLDVNHPQAILTMFKSYAGIKVYSDCSIDYAIDNIFFQMLLSNNTKLRSKDDFVNKSNSNDLSRRAIALCGDEREVWVDSYEGADGIYLSSSAYKSKMDLILSNQKTIRLKDHPKFKWSDIFPIKYIPGNCALMADNFILSKETKVKNNAFPIIRNFKKSLSLLTILTATKAMNHSVENKVKSESQLFEEVEQEVSKMKSKLNDFCRNEKINTNIQVIPFFKDLLKRTHSFDLHDRYLITKYAIVEVGKGFDLLPRPMNKEKVDHKIRVKTIFDKDTYDDLRSLTPLYTDYVKWYKEKHNPETFLPFE